MTDGKENKKGSGVPVNARVFFYLESSTEYITLLVNKKLNIYTKHGIILLYLRNGGRIMRKKGLVFTVILVLEMLLANFHMVSAASGIAISKRLL